MNQYVRRALLVLWTCVIATGLIAGFSEGLKMAVGGMALIGVPLLALQFIITGVLNPLRLLNANAQ